MTTDIMTIETAWGDADIGLTIERGPELLAAERALSDYIASLPLTAEQNDELVRLAVDQTVKAERNSFFEGGPPRPGAGTVGHGDLKRAGIRRFRRP